MVSKILCIMILLCFWSQNIHGSEEYQDFEEYTFKTLADPSSTHTLILQDLQGLWQIKGSENALDVKDDTVTIHNMNADFGKIEENDNYFQMFDHWVIQKQLKKSQNLNELQWKSENGNLMTWVRIYNPNFGIEQNAKRYGYGTLGGLDSYDVKDRIVPSKEIPSKKYLQKNNSESTEVIEELNVLKQMEEEFLVYSEDIRNNHSENSNRLLQIQTYDSSEKSTLDSDDEDFNLNQEGTKLLDMKSESDPQIQVEEYEELLKLSELSNKNLRNEIFEKKQVIQNLRKMFTKQETHYEQKIKNLKKWNIIKDQDLDIEKTIFQKREEVNESRLKTYKAITDLQKTKLNDLEKEFEKIVNERKESRQQNKCAICFKNEKNTVNIPCGHVCSCTECAAKLRKKKDDKCPICREEVKNNIQIYN